jgi:LysR family glycine cleavage system transcriptional activator
MMARQKIARMVSWQAFEAAARLSSFVRAAHELGITASAVSQHVKALEEAYGVRLFDRSPHSVALTPEGLTVFPGVRDGFATLGRAVSRLGEREYEHVVRISAPPSFASRWLLPRLHRFIRANPTLTPSIDASSALVDFANEDVDIAIRYGLGRYAGLESRLLLQDHVFPVCSPALLKDPEARLPLAALRGMDLVHDSLAGSGDLPTWAAWLEQHGVKHPAVTGGIVLSSALAIEAAVEGHGVALGRGVIVADDLAQGRLVRPFAEATRLQAAYHLVHRPAEALPRKLGAFIRWIEEEARLSSEAQLFVAADAGV